jgi:hypothetical protein
MQRSTEKYLEAEVRQWNFDKVHRLLERNVPRERRLELYELFELLHCDIDMRRVDRKGNHHNIKFDAHGEIGARNAIHAEDPHALASRHIQNLVTE